MRFPLRGEEDYVFSVANALLVVTQIVQTPEADLTPDELVLRDAVFDVYQTEMDRRARFFNSHGTLQ